MKQENAMEETKVQEIDRVDQLERCFLSMQSELDSLKVIVSQLKRAHCSQENEESQMREWMEYTVKLPQYFEVLRDNGFEDLESMRDITMEHLREIGIDKIGHRLKLMKSVAVLKAEHTEV